MSIAKIYKQGNRSLVVRNYGIASFRYTSNTFFVILITDLNL